MQEWMILQLPGLWILYGGSLLCFLAAHKCQSGVLPWIGSALCAAATTVLLLMGGSLWEAAAWLSALLLVLMKGEGK